jgi:hypothetical protein
MKFLILGQSDDLHAAHIYEALSQAGAPVNYLDTRLFPTQIKMSWQPDIELGYLTLPGNIFLNLKEIKSVFWRSLGEVYIPHLKNSEQQKVAWGDAMSLVRSLIQLCPARWINSWQAYQFHKEKPRQLTLAKQLGIPIPLTLIGNDSQKILDFARTGKKFIFKPVYGGATTELITPAHLERERLDQVLRISPVTIQEYIPGTNIRTYVIGDAVYSAEIRSPALDFREDTEAQIIPIDTPLSVANQSRAIARGFMMEWTAIDWRLKPTGEYIFLEANPSPMFIHFENQTGYPITQKIIQLLTHF